MLEQGIFSVLWLFHGALETSFSKHVYLCAKFDWIEGEGSTPETRMRKGYGVPTE